MIVLTITFTGNIYKNNSLSPVSETSDRLPSDRAAQNQQNQAGDQMPENSSDVGAVDANQASNQAQTISGEVTHAVEQLPKS